MVPLDTNPSSDIASLSRGDGSGDSEPAAVRSLPRLRLRRPLKGGTLYPHVTFMSGRGRTIHQSFVDVIKLVFVKFLIIFLRLVPLARFQDTSFALFFIWY